MIKLNFGCGSIQPLGWWHVDKNAELFEKFEPESPVIYDSTDHLPNNFFDIIVAHAVIQEFEWHNIIEELKELYRILKPNGILRISLPDIVEGFRAFYYKDMSFFPNGEEDPDDKFCAWLTWYSTSRSLLTPKALKLKLDEAGFKGVGQVAFKKTTGSEEVIELDTREGEFYFMEARK